MHVKTIFQRERSEELRSAVTCRDSAPPPLFVSQPGWKLRLGWAVPKAPCPAPLCCRHVMGAPPPLLLGNSSSLHRGFDPRVSERKGKKNTLASCTFFADTHFSDVCGSVGDSDLAHAEK